MFRLFGQILNTNLIAYAHMSRYVVQVGFRFLTILCFEDNIVCISNVKTSIAVYRRLFLYTGNNAFCFNTLPADRNNP